MDKYSRYGHRNRMRQSYLTGGIASLDSCNVLELYLSLVIPQKDVKPIAYSLMNKYGELERVFEADYLDLQTVSGVGENTAYLIKACGEIMKRGMSCNDDESKALDSGRRRTAFAYSLMNDTDKNCAVVFLSNNCECLSYSYFNSDDDMSDIRSCVIKKALGLHSPMCYIVRKDSFGDADIYEEDVRLLVDLKVFLLKFGVAICDYVIIGINDAYVVSESPNKKLLYS